MKGEPVDPAEIYFRSVPTFEVSDLALAWLPENVFIGTGARGRIAWRLRSIGWFGSRQNGLKSPNSFLLKRLFDMG